MRQQRKTVKAATPLHQWTVTHGPNQVIFPAIDRGDALKKAAELWGVDWKWLQGVADATPGGKSRKPMCTSCGKEYGKPGDKAGYCPICQQVKERYRRDMAQVRGQDRRARYGH